ncbi:MAG: hypothetical protein HC913_03520 [Microscillaceae bacterium]|nr:hypothetical protein [Microscillaceae bacterium]
MHVGIVVAPEEVIAQALYPALPRQGGEYYIWHALDQVRLDKLDARGIFHLQRQVYTHELHSLRHYGAKPED